MCVHATLACAIAVVGVSAAALLSLPDVVIAVTLWFAGVVLVTSLPVRIVPVRRADAATVFPPRAFRRTWVPLRT